MRTHLIEPCLPSPAETPPSGPGWLHEIKHDGFRLMARRELPQQVPAPLAYWFRQGISNILYDLRRKDR